jgi:isoquinoline 1-oxidoreductase subunit beta
MLDHTLAHRLDRRGFLKAGAALGGGLTLTVALPPALRPAWAAAETSQGFAPNAFVRIDRQGAVTLVMPMVEMGQGVYTAQAMLLAEELEVGLDQVRLEHAPPNDALYANSLLHVQTTGLSASIRAFWTPLRQAGAVGRTLLVAAAAKRWGVDPTTCRAQHAVVSDATGSRHLGYGELVDAAAALPVPAPNSVALKDPKDFRLIGTPAKRLDTPHKVDGRAEFGTACRCNAAASFLRCPFSLSFPLVSFGGAQQHSLSRLVDRTVPCPMAPT